MGFEADKEFCVFISASSYSERPQSEKADNEGWLYLFVDSVFLLVLTGNIMLLWVRIRYIYLLISIFCLTLFIM